MNLRPNKDIETKYRKRLYMLIRWMNKSVICELEALYKKKINRITTDSRPSVDFSKEISELFKKYTSIFNKRSELYAKDVVEESLEYADKKIEQEITKVKRKINEKAPKYVINSTPMSIKDVESALIKENVSLIKSIPSKYFDQIETDVYLSLAEGANLSKLSKRLEKNYGIARRRANIIARDQTNKANSLLSIKRSESLGITKGIWRHSGGGKEPRKSHVLADGKEFDLNKGLKIDGEYILPSILINCRCTHELVFDFLEDETPNEKQESLYENYVIPTKDLKTHTYKNSILVEIEKDFNSVSETTTHVSLPKSAFVKKGEQWEVDFNKIKGNDEILFHEYSRKVGTGSGTTKWEKKSAKYIDFENDIIKPALNRKEITTPAYLEKNKYDKTITKTDKETKKAENARKKQKKQERKEHEERLRTDPEFRKQKELEAKLRNIENAKKMNMPYEDLDGKWVFPNRK